MFSLTNKGNALPQCVIIALAVADELKAAKALMFELHTLPSLYAACRRGVDAQARG